MKVYLLVLSILIQAIVYGEEHDYQSQYSVLVKKLIGESIGSGKVTYKWESSCLDPLIQKNQNVCYVFIKDGQKFKVLTYQGEKANKENLLTSVCYDGATYYAYVAAGKSLHISSDILKIRDLFTGSFANFPLTQNIFQKCLFKDAKCENISNRDYVYTHLIRDKYKRVRKLKISERSKGREKFIFPELITLESDLFDENAKQMNAISFISKIKVLKVEDLPKNEIFYMPAASAERIINYDMGVEFDL